MNNEDNSNNFNESTMENLKQKIAELSVNVEKMRLAEYVNLLNHPWRLAYLNFIAGVARGMGTLFGFTFLAGFLLLILQKMAILNLPIVGGFIADIVRIVQFQLHLDELR